MGRPYAQDIIVIRFLTVGFLILALLAPMAGAKNRKPHPAASHPNPAKHVKQLRKMKVKPHKAG